MGVLKDGMRGLVFFIAEVRNCRSTEDESKRVNKELSNIRGKFSNSKSLTPYDKRKYLCKLIFAFLLGYEVDFGYLEAVSLILSNKVIDKMIAFLFLSVMTGPDHSAQKVIRNSIMTELKSSDPVSRSMALQAVTNMASPEIAEDFFKIVLEILISPGSDDSNKESASICLLALFRCANKEVELRPEDDRWKDQVLQLLNHSNPSVVSSAISLLTYLSQQDPGAFIKVVSLTVSRLSMNVDSAPASHMSDQIYHNVNDPFTLVKLLSLLQTQPGDVIIRLSESELKHVMKRINDQTLSQRSKKAQHVNAKHAIFFEAVNLAVHCEMADICLLFLSHLMELLTWDQANYRHCSMLALISMTSISQVFEQIKTSCKAIIDLLKTEPDNNVKRTAISLLCAMCTKNDVVFIVGELMDYLKSASHDIKEDLLLKIPLICGQFSSNSKWYVETILSLMTTDGYMIGEEICNRVIAVIMSKPDLQKHSVNILYEALASNSLHDNLVRVSSFVFGEYGHLSSIEPAKLLSSLHSKFFLCTLRTQYLMLSAYAKMSNLFSTLVDEVLQIFMDKNIWCSSDVELQTRAVEYVNIIKSKTLMGDVFDEMPPFSTEGDSDEMIAFSAVEDVDSPNHTQELEDISLFVLSTTNFSDERMDPLLLKKQFLTSDSGLIHDGRDLSVSLQVHPGSQHSQISVVITVASKGSPIANLNLQTPQNFQNSLRIDAVSSSTFIPSWGQGTFNLQVVCHSLFTSLPSLTLEYQCNSESANVSLVLPISIAKFIHTQEVDSNLFTQRWMKLSEASQMQSVFSTNSTGFLLFTELAKMGINYLPRIDPNQNNFVGSCIFYCDQPVGILMRIEPMGEQVRMTSRMTAPSSELFHELNSLIELI